MGEYWVLCKDFSLKILSKERLNWLSERVDWFVFGFVILFLVSGITTLSNYGLTWDEGLGNLFFGERYLYYLTTFQHKYLDFKADLSLLREFPLNLYISPFREFPYEFPPFADILSAATMHLFAYRLQWLDPVDGFHLFTVILSALLLWVLYRFATPRLGKFTAFMATLFMGTFPRFWSDMHFNPKDVPEMVFYGFVIMAYVVWYENPRWPIALGIGFLFGSALAIKANAIFIPIVLLLGMWPWGLNPRSWMDVFTHLKKYLGHYALMGISGIGFYLLSWPYLYADPLRVKNYFYYIRYQGERTGMARWNWQPLLMTISTMPEVMLIFLLIGLSLLLYRSKVDRSGLWRLLPIWLILPVARISLPGMANFDGIRHFMEFLPAAALIAGYGVNSLVSIIAKERLRLRFVIGLIVIFMVGVNAIQIVKQYYPYQYLYYNQLIGGMSGADRIFEEADVTDYWASSYRYGMQWINQNAVEDSSLYVPVAEWLVQMTAPLWLRPDIQVLTKNDTEWVLETDTTVYVMFITRSEFYDAAAKYCIRSNKTPVHQVIVDGVPVMKIYQLSGFR